MKNFLIKDKLLISLLLFLGIGGLVGGLSFITHPDGSSLGMTTEYLKHSPVDDYFWPGVFLILFMGFWPLVNVYAILTPKPWADVSLCLLGILAMVWVVYESVIIQTFSPLQPTIFLIGCVLFVGGLMKRKSTRKIR